MITAGVVLVLFRPDDEALANVDRARAGCPRTIVVDNTPDPDTAVHERLRGTGLEVLDNRNHGGLAGAYNAGVSRLLEQGCDLVFLLDQDSTIEDGFVDRMTAAAAGLGEAAYLIGPRVWEIEMAAWFPSWADDPASVVTPTDQLISSGSAVSSAAFERLGRFNEDLFIDWVDVEYCLRAAQADVPRYVVPAETLRQRQGVMTRHGDTYTTNHPAWRRYYHVRNGIWTARRYHPPRAALAGGVRLLLRELWTALRFESGKTRKAVAMVAGAVDGARGRLGPFADARPRTARYCTR